MDTLDLATKIIENLNEAVEFIHKMVHELNNAKIQSHMDNNRARAFEIALEFYAKGPDETNGVAKAILDSRIASANR